MPLSELIVDSRQEMESALRTFYVVLAVVLVVLAGIVLYLVFADSPAIEQTEVVTDQAAIDSTTVAFVSPPFLDDYGTMRVPGYVDNVSSQTVRLATLEITLLDEDGNLEEVVIHEVADVPAGGRKTFDVNAGTIAGSRTAIVAVTRVEVVVP